MANDEKTIAAWASQAAAPRPVKLMLTGDSRSERFAAFARQMAELAPQVGLKIERADDETPPELRIHPNISYQAIPRGHELGPFLKILSGGTDSGAKRPLSDTHVLEKLAMPAMIKVYISAECPFCPQTVESLASLAERQEMVHLLIIDAAMFPEKAAADNVSSVPTVFLDEQFRWTGSIQLPEIIDILVNRDPAQLSSETLKQILYDGKAAELAGMMAEAGKVFPALYELLTHPLWPVRLGAMVTVEYLAEQRHDLIGEVVRALWEQFDDVEDPVRGDILYLFGETAHPDAREKIDTVLQGSYSGPVKEAAADAAASF